MHIYLEPKRSIETNISRNSSFHDERSFWHNFLVLSSVTNLKKHFIGVYRLVRQLLWNILEQFLGPKRLLKSQMFERKAIFPVKKSFWPVFSRNMEHDNCQRTFYKGPQGILTTLGQILWTFICDLRGRWNQTFQITAVFTMKEVFGIIFLVLSSVTNHKEQFKRILKLLLQLLGNLIKHFFRT